MAQHGYLREFDEVWDRGREGERGWRAEEDFRGRERDRGFMLHGDERFDRGSERARRNFSNSQDELYLSWRDRHMREIDRDYADYRREREQQFQREFDSWRRQRRQQHGNPEPLQTGMTQSGLSSDPTGELQLTENEVIESASGPDPMATATLGTSSSRARR
jgi:hypothetical protein